MSTHKTNTLLRKYTNTHYYCDGCDRPVLTGQFCEGCRQHVCDRCDIQKPWGPHVFRDHIIKNEGVEYD